VDDLQLIAHKNNCWKEGYSGWRAVVDVDELVEIDQSRLDEEDEWGATIIRTEGWNMVALRDDMSFVEIQHGFKDERYNKKCIFDSGNIDDMGYEPGAHQYHPTGILQMSQRVYVLRHYRYWNPEELVRRTRYTCARLSKSNLERGFGVQYLQTESEVRAEFDQARRKAVSVPGFQV
jgi:hypothetical protein